MSEENQEEKQKQINDKEYNFRQIEAKLAKEREEKERIRQENERLKAEYEAKLSSMQTQDDDDDDDPYIDKKKLQKQMAAFEKKLEQKFNQRSEQVSRSMLEQEKQQAWLKQNNDFYDVLKHAETFAQENPEIAETILQMPEGFARQQLVYHNIKKLGLHEPKKPEPTVQDKINQNRRSPYYQPSGVATDPYAGQSDFSPAGQKQAYEKLKQLKANLRL